MLEPPPIFSSARHIHDIREIEDLARLVLDLSVPLDPIVCEAFERLVELAGSRDFLPAVASLHHYLNHVKWTREDIGNCGYIAPWGAICQIGLINILESKTTGSKGLVGGMVGARAGTGSRSRYDPTYEFSRHYPASATSAVSALSSIIPPDPFNIPVDTREIQKMGLARAEPSPLDTDGTANGLYQSPQLAGGYFPFSFASPFADTLPSTYQHLPSHFNTGGKGIKGTGVYIKFVCPAKPVSPSPDEGSTGSNASAPAASSSRKAQKESHATSTVPTVMDMQMITNWYEAARDVGNYGDDVHRTNGSSSSAPVSTPRMSSHTNRMRHPSAQMPPPPMPSSFPPYPTVSPPSHRVRNKRQHPYVHPPTSNHFGTTTPFSGGPFTTSFSPFGTSALPFHPALYPSVNYSPYIPPHHSAAYTPRTPLPDPIADASKMTKRKRGGDASGKPAVKAKRVKLTIGEALVAGAAEAVESSTSQIQA
ncbi:uncharacterized protein SPPG_00192 [Spizellomyces punctatus DAOM BR117]|uniref:Uncharacterized protein n=1 Tax=Spizellomyces punctatus (strain DAOM BR117) TaxID=645134 RepID=A0A0L0HUB4_SPIPD|nr:uncharacterized protein SPPG_00192 [Spizellomyces punctatus DAOM BR117]KND04464.1 hypothetical protein SPPG_00192 [Spizellomyces punctatus DAOM BR117]|eukprot:XP_016612503.1 hypothetical protein SPPG_00192 [Spizellomyces punctatus DAOM BR117]